MGRISKIIIFAVILLALLLSEVILRLPEIYVFGNVPDLRCTMVANPELQRALEDY